MLHFENLYWFFPSAICTDDIKRIIKLGKKQNKRIGRIGTFPANKFKRLNKTQNKILKQTRDSHVSFIDERWLYDLIQPYFLSANKFAGWNFDINWVEQVQFAQYTKDQHYDWHCDSGVELNDDVASQGYGKIRKLSIVISLSDPKDYEGGDFEFQFRSLKDPTITKIASELKPMGSVLVFPSYIWHRVKPITKGLRYSLVTWVRGHPFR